MFDAVVDVIVIVIVIVVLSGTRKKCHLDGGIATFLCPRGFSSTASTADDIHPRAPCVVRKIRRLHGHPWAHPRAREDLEHSWLTDGGLASLGLEVRNATAWLLCQERRQDS